MGQALKKFILALGMQILRLRHKILFIIPIIRIIFQTIAGANRHKNNPDFIGLWTKYISHFNPWNITGMCQ